MNKLEPGQVRICCSDGTVTGTTVENEDGPVADALNVNVSVGVDGFVAKAHIELDLCQFDVIAQASYSLVGGMPDPTAPIEPPAWGYGANVHEDRIDLPEGLTPAQVTHLKRAFALLAMQQQYSAYRASFLSRKLHELDPRAYDAASKELRAAQEALVK